MTFSHKALEAFWKRTDGACFPTPSMVLHLVQVFLCFCGRHHVLRSVIVNISFHEILLLEVDDAMAASEKTFLQMVAKGAGMSNVERLVVMNKEHIR